MNAWISTDGNKVDDANDGLFAVPTEGDERGLARRFFQVPNGAECSGPSFSPDNSALFISVQHPGEGGYFEDQINTWPTADGIAPRPSVVVVTRSDDPTLPIVGIAQGATGDATPGSTPVGTPMTEVGTGQDQDPDNATPAATPKA